MRVVTLGGLGQQAMVDERVAREVLQRLGANLEELGVTMNEFRRGVEVELEQTNVVDEAARLALERLSQVPDYYSRLVQTIEAREPLSLNQTVKAQWIRVADVFLIGPLMIVGGGAMRDRGSEFWGTVLTLLGVGTIFFNGYNWWVIDQAMRSRQP